MKPLFPRFAGSRKPLHIRIRPADAQYVEHERATERPGKPDVEDELHDLQQDLPLDKVLAEEEEEGLDEEDDPKGDVEEEGGGRVLFAPSFRRLLANCRHLGH